MKRRAPRVIFKSAAREAIERADGYAPNAESQHTRRAAHGEHIAVEVDTVADLQRRCRRAWTRHRTHPEPVIRKRAREDAIALEQRLRRGGHAVR